MIRLNVDPQIYSPMGAGLIMVNFFATITLTSLLVWVINGNRITKIFAVWEKYKKDSLGLRMESFKSNRSSNEVQQ